MIEWLTEVLVFEKVYWYLAIPFTVLLVIQLISTFVGLGGNSDLDGGDDGGDIGDDGDIEPGFRILTVRNLVTFFAVFGWSGITFSSLGFGQVITALISTILGIIMLLVVSALFYFIIKLAYSGTMDIQRAVGATGEVYLPIPANRSGVGKVNITFQGSFRELEAMTDEGRKIPRGAMITVKAVVNNSILLVEKTNKGEF
ncbi:hypothetical protein HYG86_11950 [Alkalicella caledoniensis]|uniref:NfeD-like C-terminal domain-containing protein n=1 Tax=Alkalicella caledoniensis TaxID=2731377 RepID=A0A7G9W9R3_ALKCA|nr:hypothetical protein [Alkalicella caledoniensis]QNO15425.1 hypothetical protein HYG86_11950 [Alkalicella caledoniensis]